VTGKDAKPGKPPRKPPRGRPPRHQGERLSKNRTFRVRGGLDEKLQAAAAASGRSVSEEIEFRLDQSFDRDAFIGLVLGGDENAKVLRTIALVMKLESRNGHWLKDMKAVETVGWAADFLIRCFGPPFQWTGAPLELMANDALQMAEKWKANLPWTAVKPNKNDETMAEKMKTTFSGPTPYPSEPDKTMLDRMKTWLGSRNGKPSGSEGETR
jgi:hypothetical protein